MQALLEPINGSFLIEKERNGTVFDNAEIRPSSVGSLCQRAEVTRMLYALTEDERFRPHNPEGKKDIEGTAAIGDIVEDKAIKLLRQIHKKKGQRVMAQSRIIAPGLYNPTLKEIIEFGTDQLLVEKLKKKITGRSKRSPVVSHRDGFIPQENVDIEIKAVSVKAIPSLPNNSHVDQILLRIYWAKKSQRKIVKAVLFYFFRETFYIPGKKKPLRFYFEPQGDLKAVVIRNEQGEAVSTFPLEYLENLHQRMLDQKKAVITTILPERMEGHFSFPCYLKTDYFKTECPWRYNCWAEEIAREKEPGVMIQKASEIIHRLKRLKESKKQFDGESRNLDKEVKALQVQLNHFFEGLEVNKITTTDGLLTISRTEVNNPEKNIPANSYFKYSIRQQK